MFKKLCKQSSTLSLFTRQENFFSTCAPLFKAKTTLKSKPAAAAVKKASVKSAAQPILSASKRYIVDNNLEEVRKQSFNFFKPSEDAQPDKLSSFISSFSSVDQLRADLSQKQIVNEYAFIGRSNVGKSSLINSIFQSHKLVKTSKTPVRCVILGFFFC